jgi:dTDP-4-dehydrorhamnose 3,5-epimerase
MPFTFEPLALPEVVLITPRLFTDERGTFLEAYKQAEFEAAGMGDTFVQDNMSVSCPGVLRGLHFQYPPYAQAKLVRCVQGRIFDVAVDIRPQSATWGRWVAATLDAHSAQMLYIPAGFAHGFLVLDDAPATVHYKTSQPYHQPSDAGIVWNDPAIGIDWPVVRPLTLSDKDQTLPLLAQLSPSLQNLATA